MGPSTARNRVLGCWHTIVFLILTTSVLLSLGQTIQDEPSTSHGPDGLQIREGNRVALRIMPLGASITAGYRSTDGNGYRKYLWEQLRYEGWEVDMVGSLRSGDMQDNVSGLGSILESMSLTVQTLGKRRSLWLPGRPDSRSGQEILSFPAQPHPNQVCSHLFLTPSRCFDSNC